MKLTEREVKFAVTGFDRGFIEACRMFEEADADEATRFTEKGRREFFADLEKRKGNWQGWLENAARVNADLVMPAGVDMSPADWRDSPGYDPHWREGLWP